MNACTTLLCKTTLCIATIVALLASSLHSAQADDAEPLEKFKSSDSSPLPQRYKDDESTDVSENARIIGLLKQYATDYTPIPISEDVVNTLEFSFGTRNWQASFGRKYFFSSYEGGISFYINQVWNDIEEYQLWIQTSDQHNLSITRDIYEDLEYTLTSFGIAGTLYYLSTENNILSLGLEIPILGLSRLRVDSEKANKSYIVNGLSLLGFPVWGHSNFIPFKVRYQPTDNFALELNIQYVTYQIWQETTRSTEDNASTPGEWFAGCDDEACRSNEVIPSIGLKVTF